MHDAWRPMRSACASVPRIWGRFRRKWIAKVQRVPALYWAHKAMRCAWGRFLVLQWHLAFVCVTGCAEVCGFVGRAGRGAFTHIGPTPRSWLHKVVRGAAFQLGFRGLFLALQLELFRTKLLRLKLQLVQRFFGGVPRV